MDQEKKSVLENSSGQIQENCKIQKKNKVLYGLGVGIGICLLVLVFFLIVINVIRLADKGVSEEYITRDVSEYGNWSGHIDYEGKR